MKVSRRSIEKHLLIDAKDQQADFDGLRFRIEAPTQPRLPGFIITKVSPSGTTIYLLMLTWETPNIGQSAASATPDTQLNTA